MRQDKPQHGYYSKLAKQTGLSYKTIYRRINTLGWDFDIAISTPLTSPRAYKKILKRKQKNAA